MAYSITQARTVLTAAELELFDQSRAEPIKALTLARLRGKVTRARTLRDKYRDLYRRQTVAVRGASYPKGRSPVGADNERTQRKADILQEVLGRFEARVTQLESREARESSSSSAAAPKRSAPKAAAQKAVPQAPVKPAAKKSATPTASKSVRKTATKAPSSTTAVASAASGTNTNTQSASPKASADKNQLGPVAAADTHGASAARPEPLQAAVLNQHATRSSKAPSDKAPTSNGKAHAPLVHAPIDMVPAALRGNPMKQAPGQIAIHAHQGSAVRRAQGKRDSR
ncbi:MAG: hypothetical protein ACK41V_15580 [Acidovorax sp.]|uniref:hypothetical protein n=1 Tax=Acidovorax sp. TaxID=1872122 RepID=UPI00391C84D4